MTTLASDFKTNLFAGFKLAFFQRCELDHFRFGLHQFALLLALDLCLEIGSDWITEQPNPDFNIDALPVYALNLLCLLVAAYLIGLLIRSNEALLRIGIILYSFGPLVILLDALINDPNQRLVAGKTGLWFSHGLSVYIIVILFRALYLAANRRRLATVAGLALMLAVTGVPAIYFEEDSKFWQIADKDEDEEADGYAEYRALDAETLMYRQPDILQRELSKLTPQRKKTSDLFFVGFAGYATQDVFSKEVAYAKQLFDERFDTPGHSINLVNHLRTIDNTALATASNLAATLKHIGKLMDPEEDVLFLYLTSHGSQEDGLAVSFWPLALNNISPEKLKAMLDEAGIKWRVVVVSACYSGGFVKPLRGPGTVVATAAAEDRTSFGCGNEFDFTYFGEAIFKDQLRRQYSLLTALQEAGTAISQREAREKLTPSLPQLSAGEKIAAKLQRLGEEAQHRQCAAAKADNGNC